MSIIADIFYNTPNIILFVAICIIGIIFTVVGIKLVWKIFPIELRLKDNVAIGYISANTSVLFAVLAGFIISYMLGNFGRAQEITRIEVSRLSDIHRDASRLDRHVSIVIKKGVEQYIEMVINQGWPNMQQGKKIDLQGEKILTNLRRELISYKPKNIDQSLALTDIHKGLEELYNARGERLFMNESALGVDIWVILVLGTLFTMIMNFLYGMEHYLHMILAPFVSIIVISLLFVIVAMDRPFRGDFSIKPKEFQGALMLMRIENDFLKNLST